MLRLTTFAAVSLAALAAAPAAAQTQAADVRCLILSNAFSRMASEDQAKKAAEYSLAYYLGRVDGQYNEAQLRAAVAEQQKTLQVATAGTEMQGCARRVQASVQRLRSLAPPPPAAAQPKR
jgi:primosomal protein N''